MAHNGRISADDALIAGLAAGKTIEEAAEAAGISARTAHRRLKEPDFKQKLTDARAAILDQAIGLLSGAMGKAVGTLEKLLEAQGESVRLGSAKAIIELSAKLRDSINWERRLQALEDEQAQSEKEGKP